MSESRIAAIAAIAAIVKDVVAIQECLDGVSVSVVVTDGEVAVRVEKVEICHVVWARNGEPLVFTRNVPEPVVLSKAYDFVLLVKEEIAKYLSMREQHYESLLKKNKEYLQGR
ncbi:MAG: hypothetical protein G01um101429_184 [Parcubacteria group bacterium Gr01-1014_29]|nr:MAG: hypothetical protein G01um101429_184 [Parcubacteria group bacterium Gr01-1014_29]